MTFAADSQRDVEQAVIGAVLHDATTLALLPALSSQDFGGPLARAIWDSIRNLEAKNLPIDTATVGDELARSRKIRQDEREAPGEEHRARETIWGYLSQCALQVTNASNAIDYARRVRDHALARRVAETMGEVITAWKRQEHTGAELLSMALAGLSLLDAEQPERVTTIAEAIRRRVDQLAELARQRATGERQNLGSPTGVKALDDVLGGWQPGIVSLIAARPSHGKSSLGLATADASTAAGDGAHVFSLEDTETVYADRAMARASRVPGASIRNSTLSSGQVQALQVALKDLGNRKSWLFDDRSGLTAQEIVRSVRRHKKANGTKIAIVDYIQLVAPSEWARRRHASTHEILSENVTVFADAAKQDGIAYVVMSQLNRDLEKRTDKRPQLSDLRESGSLEERARCVVGIYRGAAYGRKQTPGVDYDGDSPLSEDEFQSAVQLLVLKASQGATGRVRATWTGPTTRME